jgi:hypothetical protein
MELRWNCRLRNWNFIFSGLNYYPGNPGRDLQTWPHGQICRSRPVYQDSVAESEIKNSSCVDHNSTTIPSEFRFPDLRGR